MQKTLQMKRALRTVLLFLLLGTVEIGKGHAQNYYDFAAVCSSGQTLYYNILNTTNHHVEVTCPGDMFWDYPTPIGEVTIPNSVVNNGISYLVTSIGKYAFSYCDDVISVNIPNSIGAIKESAFYQCTGLTSITIPQSVTNIGSFAFEGCSNITSVIIPNSVIFIGANPFENCSGLEQIIVEEGNPYYDSRNNCNAIIKTSSNELNSGCKNTIIPNSVTTIGGGAFWGCSGLTSIIIPNSVTSIKGVAFCGCDNLSSIIIPNSVTSIGINPFDCCSGLEQIVVETENPVYDSRNSCNALIQTNTNDLISGCKNTIIPNSVTSIGDLAFRDCTGLYSITIPSSVVSIGREAFSLCSNLSSLKIPNSVDTINRGAFAWCRSISSITFGNSISSIGDRAFIGCSGLNEITVLAETPPLLSNDVFYDVPCTTLTVPCHCIPAYANSDWHNYFSTIIQDCTGVAEDTGNVITVYPNPTNGQIKIEVEDLKHITISNILGQTIYEGNANGDTFEYNFGKHDSGLYLIKIETANGMVAKKISVVR